MEEQKINKKITYSVVAVLVIVLIAIGATYAYFSAEAITDAQTVTTATMGLEFDDRTATVLASGIIPVKAENVLKDTQNVAKKTFKLKKTTETNVYATIELTDLNIPTSLAEYDFKWMLYQGENKVATGDFGGKTSGDIVIATNQLVNSTEGVEYSLYIWINETGVSQNGMQGQTFSTKIKATGSKTKLNTLASNILGENNANVTSAADQLHVQQGDITKSEMGFPTYYYNGTVSNTHYVSFGDILWQIVRINEDGTIKLMSTTPVPDYTLVRLGEPNYKESTIKTAVEEWYETNIGNNPNLDNKVVMSTFCNDISGNYSAATDRINNNKQSYVCPGNAVKVYSKVGLVTADELKFAGSYLSGYYWTLTPSTETTAYYFQNTALASRNGSGFGVSARAVINLSPDVIISYGNGQTLEQAWVVAENPNNVSTTFELNYVAGMESPTSSEFARALRAYPDGSTVVLQNGTFEVSLYDTYYIPKNLTIVAGENAVVKGISFADSSKVVEGLTLSNITFSNGKGVYSERSFKNLTINNCTFEDGSSIRIGMGANAASRTNENVTIRNNNFSGSLESYSHIQIANAIGTTTVESNDIKDGRNSVQFSSVSGTANVRNNKIADSSDAAFRIGIIAENTNINISGNTISNAIKPSTGAIARIGNDSGIPASATISITNNTYDGVAWPNTTWSNIQGEFGINAAGEQVES